MAPGTVAQSVTQRHLVDCSGPRGTFRQIAHCRYDPVNVDRVLESEEAIHHNIGQAHPDRLEKQ